MGYNKPKVITGGTAVKFCDMPYERIDLKYVTEGLCRAAEKLAVAEKIADAAEAFKERETVIAHYQTMSTLAYIRHTVNTLDEFYEKENDFNDESAPIIEESEQKFTEALLSSKLRSELEERYGKLLFVNAELSRRCFSPEIIPDLQEENRLSSEYQKLIASAQLDFNGETLSLAQLGAYKENPDRAVRHAAYKAESDFYMSNAQKLDEIFDSLVKCRTRIAKKLGFNTFTELAYCRRTRNCYNAEDVKSFRSRIERDAVPVVCRLKELQKKRIGIADMKIYDDVFSFPNGNPRPDGTAQDILAAGKKMYEQMSDETGEFINFMYDNGLMDVLSAKGKAAGGYCTEILEYKSPFIFSNFNGTSGDVDVLTHEAGHAFAYYSVRDKMEISDQLSPTMESCEVHSMSMEFFAWPWHELFYGDDAGRSRFAHLESALVFLPYGTMVDEFQHIVYDNPDLTPAERHEKWLELEHKYRPYMDFGDVDFYASGRGWQRQLHIYLYPFYYIDYCLAQTAALEFWALSQKDYDDAWRRYNRFVSFGGTKSFKELCESAGIDDPFGEYALKGVAETANEWLDGNG